MKIKNSNYIGIQGWQVTELGLHGPELIIYALIYQVKKFILDLQILSDWTGLEKEEVLGVLDSLKEKGYIRVERKKVSHSTKEDVYIFVSYEE